MPRYDELTDTWSVNAANAYTYTPFGGFYEGQCVENIGNPFKFTGQWHDAEIDQYYLRARMYDPAMMRFTGRDPITGDRQEPLTLHKYLYTANCPINRIDPSGKFWSIFGAISAGTAVRGAATYAAASGIESGNDFLFDVGLRMHHLIVPAMYIGAMMGPILPEVPGALGRGAVAVYDTLLTVGGATYLAADAGAKALTMWAMMHPYAAMNAIDALAQVTGPPDGIPFTPAGFIAWIAVNSQN